MKKIFIFLVVLLVLAASVLAVLVFTFDPDSARPYIEKQLGELAGNPVRIGRIELVWRSGAAFALKNIGVYPSAGDGGEAALELDELSAYVKVMPLLRRSVQIDSVVLKRPRFDLTRDPRGLVRVRGIDLERITRNLSGNQPNLFAAASLTLFIDQIRVEEGDFRIRDESPGLPFSVRIRRADLTVENVSLSGPVDFRLAFGVLSEEQNVRVKGRVRLPPLVRNAVLERVRFETDLSALQVRDIPEAFPGLDIPGFRSQPAGKITVEADRIEIIPDLLKKTDAKFSVRDGRLDLEGMPQMLEQVNAEGTFRKERLDIVSASAKSGESSVEAKASAESCLTRPIANFEVRADRIELGKWLPAGRPSDPTLRGLLSASFRGNFEGADWASVSRTLSGTGHVSVRDGVILNLNILQEIFKRLAVLPGAVEKLQARLSEDYRQKLTAPNTVLAPIDQPVAVQSGVAALDPFDLATDSFRVGGTLRAGLDGRIAGRGILAADAELSNAFIRSVEELQYLTDSQGRLQIPFDIKGILPDVTVVPDVQYAASRLAVSKTQEILDGFLQKKLGSKSPGQNPAQTDTGGAGNPSPAPESQPAQGSTPKTLLGSILEKALQEKPETAGQPQPADGAPSPAGHTRAADLLEGVFSVLQDQREVSTSEKTAG